MRAFTGVTLFCFALILIYGSGCRSTSVKAEDPVLENIERTYTVKRGGRLTIVSEFGAIDIQTADQETIQVAVTKESKFRLMKASQEALADFEVAFEQTGADLRIEGAFKQGRQHWQKHLNRLKIGFRVTLPRAYNVDLETASGSISVADLAGEVRAKTSGGSLNFGKITGTVHARTSGGNIELTSCGSAVDLKTSGGSIEVVDVGGDVHAQTSGGSLRFGAIAGSISGKTSGGSIKIASCEGDVDVHTSGGSIRLQRVGGHVNARTSGGSVHATLLTQPTRDCTLRTSGGNINVTLIPDIAVDVEADTSGGRVATDFAVESAIQGKVPKNRLKGSINGGGPLLKLRTSGGNIHLESADLPL